MEFFQYFWRCGKGGERLQSKDKEKLNFAQLFCLYLKNLLFSKSLRKKDRQHIRFNIHNELFILMGNNALWDLIWYKKS